MGIGLECSFVKNSRTSTDDRPQWSLPLVYYYSLQDTAFSYILNRTFHMVCPKSVIFLPHKVLPAVFV